MCQTASFPTPSWEFVSLSKFFLPGKVSLQIHVQLFMYLNFRGCQDLHGFSLSTNDCGPCCSLIIYSSPPVPSQPLRLGAF